MQRASREGTASTGLMDAVSDNRFAGFVNALEALWDEQGPPKRLEDFDPVLELSQKLTDTSRDSALLCADAAAFVLAETHPRGMSYRHQHGFSKLSLYRSPRHKFNVRLHIWWDSEVADEAPHEHRWPFCSTVLSGALRIKNFVIVDDDADIAPDKTTPYVQHKFFDADTSGNKAVEPVREVPLLTAATVRVVAGSQHMLWHDQPHQVFGDGGEVTATFLITGAACRDYSNVYHGQNYQVKKRVLQSTLLNAEQIAEELQRYVKQF